MLDYALPLLAAEGVPPDSAMAQLAVPFGVLVFLGSIYMLLRANMGTRRGYLVFGVSLFAFMLIMSLFWTFGAPGTPQATGPRNLPGQLPNEYQPTWTAFHETSRIAELPDYRFVTDDPGRFGSVPEHFDDEADAGIQDIQNFFSVDAHGKLIGDTWAVEEVAYAVADNGFPVIQVTYREVDQALEPIPDGKTATLYGFFDEGNIIFPGLVFVLVSLVLFLLHAFLLDRDEQRERRERAAFVAQEREPVGAGA